MNRHEVDIQAPLEEFSALLGTPGFAEVAVPQQGLGLIALGDLKGYVYRLDSARTRIRVLEDGDGRVVREFVERIRAQGVGTTHHVLD
jgi:hypothetical protein